MKIQRKVMVHIFLRLETGNAFH